MTTTFLYEKLLDQLKNNAPNFVSYKAMVMYIYDVDIDKLPKKEHDEYIQLIKNIIIRLRKMGHKFQAKYGHGYRITKEKKMNEIEYKIIRCDLKSHDEHIMIVEFQKRVNKAIRDGWSLHGETRTYTLHNVTTIYQAFIKYDMQSLYPPPNFPKE